MRQAITLFILLFSAVTCGGYKPTVEPRSEAETCEGLCVIDVRACDIAALNSRDYSRCEYIFQACVARCKR